MIDHGQQTGRAAIMEIWWMLPKRAQWCRSVLFGGATQCIRRVLSYLGRSVQQWLAGVRSVVHISKQGPRVARCASSGTIKQRLTAVGRRLIETSCGRRGCLQAELILQQRGELGRNKIRGLRDADSYPRIAETAMPAHLRHGNIVVPIG